MSDVLPFAGPWGREYALAHIARVTPSGGILPKAEKVDLRLQLSQGQLGILERVREGMASGGRVPTMEQVVMAAAEAMLRGKISFQMRREPWRSSRQPQWCRNQRPDVAIFVPISELDHIKPWRRGGGGTTIRYPPQSSFSPHPSLCLTHLNRSCFPNQSRNNPSQPISNGIQQFSAA